MVTVTQMYVESVDVQVNGLHSHVWMCAWTTQHQLIAERTTVLVDPTWPLGTLCCFSSLANDESLLQEPWHSLTASRYLLLNVSPAKSLGGWPAPAAVEQGVSAENSTQLV